MSKDVTTAVIFGAGQAGRYAYSRLNQAYEIKAYVDNDIQKQGSFLDGLPVWSEEVLVSFCKDSSGAKVLIASEYSEQIYNSLSTKINEDCLVILSASDMTRIQFGDSKQRHEEALKILHCITHTMEKLHIEHHIDAGTLLGLYRDGRLIPWDDDLDIAIDSCQLPRFIKNQCDIIGSLRALTTCDWGVNIYAAQKSYCSICKGDIRAVKLEPLNSMFPSIDVFVKYKHQDQKHYLLSSRAIEMPAKYTKTLKKHRISGLEWYLPADPGNYLTHHYGDWEKPIINWKLRDLKNTKVFNS